ncbi:hypothetical protein [Streptomyces sp. W4I9-2]|uniref:hypothetical protein n=1 Tax=Streptomyces sp. W4I9-2 TaxID=3042297 RepID=UPI002781A1D4|nr:hypothetical protein [Streptomyces sp. W4I9-2]MDQ0694180.1 hypothetical protein [Streptomyces sp. W4I9-2]
MPDTPPRQVERRIDEGAGDLETLIDLGLAEEQPVPQYEGLFLEPDMPPAEEPQ